MTAPSTVAAAMQHAIDLLRELTPTQLEDLAVGRARLEFRAQDTPAPDATPPTRDSERSPIPTVPTGAAPRGSSRRPRTPEVAAPRAGVVADVATAVEAIRNLSTPAAVAAYLQDNDRRFTTPVLKEIARGLGPTVSATVRCKADLKRNIVEGTAGFRTRSASMSGGAWAR